MLLNAQWSLTRPVFIGDFGGMAETILNLDEPVAAMYLFVLQKCCNARDHRHLPESFDLKLATIQDDLPPLISHEPVVMEDAWLPEEKEDEA